MKNDVKKFLLIGFIFVLIVVVVGVLRHFKTPRRNFTEGGYEERELVKVEDSKELSKKLSIDIKGLEDKNTEINIEDNNIARIDYNIATMSYTLKASSDAKKYLANISHTWGTPILMQSECEDEAIVDVIAQVAIDNPKVMRADWYDNDLYYSMTTQTLTTREDFLQEINRLIIKNHISFDFEEEFYEEYDETESYDENAPKVNEIEVKPTGVEVNTEEYVEEEFE